jgi:hypothetical protein
MACARAGWGATANPKNRQRTMRDNMKLPNKHGGTVPAIFVSMLFPLAVCSTQMIPPPGTVACACHLFMESVLDQDGQVYPVANGILAAHGGNDTPYHASHFFMRLAPELPLMSDWTRGKTLPNSRGNTPA